MILRPTPQGPFPRRSYPAPAVTMLYTWASSFMSKTLATAANDAPARVTLNDLRWDGAVRAGLDPLLDTIGFGSIATA